MYDGWMKSSTHFIGMFVAYNHKVPVIKNKILSYNTKTSIVLLSVAPMVLAQGTEHPDYDKDDVEILSTTFNANNQMQNFIKFPPMVLSLTIGAFVLLVTMPQQMSGKDCRDMQEATHWL